MFADMGFVRACGHVSSFSVVAIPMGEETSRGFRWDRRGASQPDSDFQSLLFKF